MERRRLLTQLLVGGSVLLTAPMIFNSCSKDDDDMPGDDTNNGGSTGGNTIDLTDPAFGALATVGGYAYKNNFIIIRSSESNYVVLSKLCTHSGCTVEYNKTSNNLPSPCHGSKFTLEGAVINGPATTSLKKYTAKLSGNSLTIS